MLIPGLLLWFIDWFLRVSRTVSSKSAEHEVRHFAAAGVTVLDVPVAEWASAPPAAGSFAFVQIPEISWIPHPFTVASYNNATRRAKFVIKSEGKWTASLAAMAQKSVSPAMTFKIDGPYGCLQTPLEGSQVVTFVSGGVGVTPMLRMMEILATDRERYSSLQEVHFVWSLRSLALFDAVDDMMMLSSHAATLREQHVDVRLQLFLTSGGGGGGGGGGAASSGVNLATLSSAGDHHRGDGDLLEMLLMPSPTSLSPPATRMRLSALEATPQAARNKAAPDVVKGRFDPDFFFGLLASAPAAAAKRTAVYICAPGPLVAAARSAASAKLPDAELHVEPFSF
jgi:predicted ferric reductase